MAPCPCSIRAFEFFVKEITGLTIRQPRPHIVFRDQMRRFGTRPPLRQLQTAAVPDPRIDNGFIPFDSDIQTGSSLSGTTRSAGETPRTQKMQVAESDANDQWHAEVQIVSHRSETTTPEAPELVEVDVTSLDDLLSAPESSNTVSPEALPSSKPNEAPQSPEKSKMQNRLERKVRRMQAGTYRREANAREKEDAEDVRQENILDRIKEMDGPDLVINQPKAETPHDPSAPKDNIKSAKTSKPKPSASTKGTPSTANNSNDPTKKEQAKTKEPWQIQKSALSHKFGDTGWTPRKRLSPDTLDGIRALHTSDPSTYTTAMLSEHFKVSPEAIRRILKSKWRPNENEIETRKERWEKRGVRKWEAMAQQGVRPPARWRQMGVKSPQARVRAKKRREDVEWDFAGEGQGGGVGERIM